MLYLEPDDIARMHTEGVVTMADHIEAIEAAYRDKGAGGVEILPRGNLWATPKTPGERPRSLKAAGALIRGLGVMGTVSYSAGYRTGINVWIQVFSSETGELLALLNGSEMSLWKTGATAAVAARALSRPESSVVAMIGTGRYARAQLLGLLAVRKVREVRCHSRNAEGRDAFARWVETLPQGVSARSCPSARDAVEGADIVVTVTTSPQPVVEGEWLVPGAHCNAVGMHYPEMREIDSAAVKRSRVLVDDMEQALQEKGELLVPLRAGEISRDHIAGELGDVLAGRIAGRESPAAITLFCSGGVAHEYMASCAMLVRKAAESGFGRKI